jgi:hypothetical protein
MENEKNLGDLWQQRPLCAGLAGGYQKL